ncbi:MAG: hypothetical protein HY437_00760 [Candidatus Magasanikbacteria bacterium]|nr:hypothetical protein [Candidatus Magasanikbacteria bacterium]
MNMSLCSTEDRMLRGGPVFDQGFSPREVRRRAFIACGPGWAGFSMPATSDNDEDEGAQERAGASEARAKECDLAVDSHRERELSLEGLEALGEEFADNTDEDGWPDDEDANPREGFIRSMEEAQAFMEANDLMPRWNTDSPRSWWPSQRWVRRYEKMPEIVSRDAVRERMARSVEGVVTRHADYGIFVQSGRDVGLVHVDTIRGCGSRAAALAFLHGNTVGTRVRVIPGAYRAAKRRWNLELL